MPLLKPLNFREKSGPLQDRTFFIPKSPADVDRIIEQFGQVYGRPPNAEEVTILEWIRQLLTTGQSADKAAAG